MLRYCGLVVIREIQFSYYKCVWLRSWILSDMHILRIFYNNIEKCHKLFWDFKLKKGKESKNKNTLFLFFYLNKKHVDFSIFFPLQSLLFLAKQSCNILPPALNLFYSKYIIYENVIIQFREFSFDVEKKEFKNILHSYFKICCTRRKSLCYSPILIFLTQQIHATFYHYFLVNLTFIF